MSLKVSGVFEYFQHGLVYISKILKTMLRFSDEAKNCILLGCDDVFFFILALCPAFGRKFSTVIACD